MATDTAISMEEAANGTRMPAKVVIRVGSVARTARKIAPNSVRRLETRER